MAVLSSLSYEDVMRLRTVCRTWFTVSQTLLRMRVLRLTFSGGGEQYRSIFYMEQSWRTSEGGSIFMFRDIKPIATRNMHFAVNRVDYTFRGHSQSYHPRGLVYMHSAAPIRPIYGDSFAVYDNGRGPGSRICLLRKMTIDYQPHPFLTPSECFYRDLVHLVLTEQMSLPRHLGNIKIGPMSAYAFATDAASGMCLHAAAPGYGSLTVHQTLRANLTWARRQMEPKRTELRHKYCLEGWQRVWWPDPWQQEERMAKEFCLRILGYEGSLQDLTKAMEHVILFLYPEDYV
ncbi:hypothetical protein HK104_009252 [Borealophlyctis nickersoniae]|nr:hypothetical protein HK104_009252 [Borealophlyctis nickersoniae]